MNQIRKDISVFWEQLAATIDQLLRSRNDDRFEAEPLLRQYREQLRKIDSNLTFHFERDDEEEGPVEMVFGCDGYPESIHSVLSLIGAAPELSGIRFKAFNDRYDPVPQIVNIGDEYCEIGEFWCALRDVGGRLHLEVYMADAPQVLDMEPRVEAVMIYLDALIGEYELMTRIWALDWFELPAAPEDFALIPLARLRDTFDRVKESIDPIGIIVH